MAWHLKVFEAGKKFYEIFRNPSVVVRSCWANRVVWWEGNSKVVSADGPCERMIMVAADFFELGLGNGYFHKT